MKKLFAAFMVLAACIPAFASVIDFEATGNRGGLNRLDDTIDGFRFNQTMESIDLGKEGYWGAYGPAQGGDFAALNNFGGIGAITRDDGATFAFNGLWIKSWYNAFTATLTGVRNGQVVGTVDVDVGDAWTQVSANFLDIDTLLIDPRLGIFLVDGIALNCDGVLNAGGVINGGGALNGGAADVPEPASLALFGLGIGGLVASRRNRPKA